MKDVTMELKTHAEKPPLNAVIAGGGTGGHLFPGIAIAQAIQSRNTLSRIRFIGSGRPLEKRVLSEAGFPLSVIPVEGIKGRGIQRQAKVMFQLPFALIKSLFILVKEWPRVVIGVGGYSAGPVVLAARLLGKKVVIHEQNRLPGVTTRLLSSLAHGVCISFEDTPLKAKGARLYLTGNPVRHTLLENTGTDPSATAFMKPSGAPNKSVLVLGGSQGAHGINKAMISAAELLVQKGVHVIHQTGEADAAEVEAAYSRIGLFHMVRPFFNDMGPIYRWADLIVCRAGATTVAEITAIGKPALFIPFPAAADDHQRLNAEALVIGGAAEMMLEKDLDGALLANRITALLSNDGRLAEMARKAALYGHPNAADAVVDVCYKLVFE
jgi:UDP-N-acetylglucosamine--N-acetylmuramyl-(pentapeptide) pyrophosphoryl-undecaprenol N-acetylglucosamine transferase